MRLIALLLQEIDGLLVGHVAGMHADAHDIPGVAQQGILQLAQPQLQIAAPVAFVQHHLLAIMRPALGIRAGADQLAYFRRSALHP